MTDTRPIPGQVLTDPEGQSEHGYCSFFVKALYNYTASDKNLLTFRAGDVIEVLTQLENGWWDGLLDEKTRGWFPSNYVELISDEAAAAMLKPQRTAPSPIESIATSTATEQRLYPMAESACKQIRALIELTMPTTQLKHAPSLEGTEARVESFLRNTTLAVHDVRQFLSSSGLSEVTRSSPQVLQKDERASLVRMQLLARESTALLSKLVLHMRELTKMLHSCAADPSRRTDLWISYCKEQIGMHEGALRLKEMIRAFAQEVDRAPPVLKVLMGDAQRAMTGSPATSRHSTLSEFGMEGARKPKSSDLGVSAEVHALLSSNVMPSPRHSAQRGTESPSIDIRTSYSTFHRLLGDLNDTLYAPKALSCEHATWQRSLRDLLEHVGSMLILFDRIDLSTSLGQLATTQVGENDTEKLGHHFYQQYASAKQRMANSANSLLVTAQCAIRANMVHVHSVHQDLASKARVLELDSEQLFEAMHRCFKVIHSTSTLSNDRKSKDAQVAPLSAALSTMHVSPLSPRAQSDSEPNSAPAVVVPPPRSKLRPSVSTSPSEISSSLGTDLEPGDIIFTDHGTVKGGTLHALVAQLTQHDKFDDKFFVTFLTTYRSFMTTKEFITLLIERFRTPAPEGLSGEEQAHWAELKQPTIRQRVLKAMKTWLEEQYMPQDAPVLSTLSNFANSDLEDKGMQNERQQLLRLIGCYKYGLGKSDQKPGITMPAPVPILPPNMRNAELMDMDPLEIARQLTLIESKLFCKIKPIECLGKAWSGPLSRTKAKGITDTIAMYNKVCSCPNPRLLAGSKTRSLPTPIPHNEHRNWNTLSLLRMYVAHSHRPSAVAC